MLRRRPLGEGVGVAGRDIEPIQVAGLLHQLLGHLQGKLLAQVEVEGLHRLLGGEAGPLVPPGLPGDLGHLQVLLRLEEPVPGPVHALGLPLYSGHAGL